MTLRLGADAPFVRPRPEGLHGEIVMPVLRAGVLARNLCRPRARGHVAAVFARSFHIRVGAAFLCVGEPAIGNGPWTLIAELGTWLQTQAPPKGPAGHWQEQAQAFTAAATAIVDAAERRDHALAQRRLADLAGKCAACHNEHR